MGQALSGVAGAESSFLVGISAPQAGLQEAVPLLSGFIPDAPYSIAIDFVWPGVNNQHILGAGWPGSCPKSLSRIPRRYPGDLWGGKLSYGEGDIAT